jgi:lysyl-tRNA synthetase class 2
MEEREVRLEKLHALYEAGIDPYPPRAQRTHTIAEALVQFAALAGRQAAISLAGRLMLKRVMGGASFAHIEDGTGRIQIYCQRDELGQEAYGLWRKLADPGDFIEVTGFLFTTKTGEHTLHVRQLRLLSKALHPLPEKYHGLADIETRYRQRYLDLIANREEVWPIFRARSRIITAMRRFLENRGFIEVETPILQPLYGGATARPFITHHNALDRDLYLRIAVELYLKRLLVGGLERVYEIGKNFRNEGIDRNHNPEFTMMECYQAYADYHAMMELTEEMIASIAREGVGTTQITYQGAPIDLTPPWRRITLRDAIREYMGIDIADYPDKEGLLAVMTERHIEADPHLARGRLIDELMSAMFKRGIPALKQPLFLMDYPRDLSPLAKAKEDDPTTVERFQAFVGGLEMGNAFTELNDPLDQRARFEDQARQRAAGDEEAQVIDEDFITALEVGMPPAGGLGVGVDRLVMLLTNQESIREVILFPTMREAQG